jgi:sugar lactone lactonase YvrE
MATAKSNRNTCDVCGRSKGISKCEGCEKIFCYNHFGNHRQELYEQLNEIKVSSDLFRQTLTDQTTDQQKHPIIQQINDWEIYSIRRIRKTANEARKMVFEHTTECITDVEVKLNKLTDQLRHSQQENDFVETDLRHWKERLTQLTEEVSKLTTITLHQDSKPLVTKIYVNITSGKCVLVIPISLILRFHYFVVPPSTIIIRANTRWKQNGIAIAGNNDKGDRLNQLKNPWGLYISDDQVAYVADTWNHRIVEWKRNATSGLVAAGGNGQGNRPDQLKEPKDVIVAEASDTLIISDRGNSRVVRWPRYNGTSGQIIISDVCCVGLAMDNDGYLYVSDSTKHEVRRWKIGETKGTVVAGGNGRGKHLDQLDDPSYIFVDDDYSVYVSDGNNHRVMMWEKGAKEGIVVAGGQGEGNDLSQLSEPRGVILDQLGTVYVADYGNNRVMRWSKGASEGSVVVGDNSQGAQSNQFHYLQDISFDRQGNLYVVDQSNHRVQRFDID